MTDGNGQFAAQDLVPGRYNVRFELTGFAKIERNNINVLLGRSFQLDTQMRVGELTETVQVSAEATPLVDTRSTLIAHNVTAEEFDRMPKGRSFQSVAMTAPVGESGRYRGRFPGQRRERIGKSVHRRWRRDQQSVERPVAPEHRVRIPAGSTGQDRRHPCRVRRCAGRRHQRGDEVRWQLVPG